MHKSTSGERIRKLIDSKGILKKEFAARCNISPVSLSRILNDRVELSPQMAEKFSKLLNVSAEYLLGQTESQEKNLNLPKEYIDLITQNEAIKKINNYLITLDIFVEKKIYINNKEYHWHIGHEYFVNPLDCDDFLLEFQILDMINNIPDLDIKYCVSIEYANNKTKEFDVEEFFYIINNFQRISKAYFLNTMGIFDDPTVAIPADPICTALKQRKETENGKSKGVQLPEAQ